MDNLPQTTIDLCRYGRVKAAVRPIRDSGVLVLLEDCRRPPQKGRTDDRVLARKGWLLVPDWRGCGVRRPAYAIHEDIDSVLRRTANAVADAQGGFREDSARSPRYALLFGPLLSEKTLDSLPAKRDARLKRQAGIIASVEKWHVAAWMEREAAVGLAEMLAAAIDECARGEIRWSDLRDACVQAVSDLACAPFSDLAETLAECVISPATEPTGEARAAMLKPIAELCRRLAGNAELEDMDAGLSRAFSALKRSPRRRTPEIACVLASAAVLADQILRKREEGLDAKDQRALRGLSRRPKLAITALNAKDYRKAAEHVRLARKRLSQLIGR